MSPSSLVLQTNAFLAQWRRELTEAARSQDHAEREYLRTLPWDDQQIRRYQARIVGIERRFNRVTRKRAGLPSEPCRHGSYYGPCRFCPPWPFPKCPPEPSSAVSIGKGADGEVGRAPEQQPGD